MNPIRYIKNRTKKILQKILLTGHTLFIYFTYAKVFVPEIVAWKPDIVHSHDGVTLPAAAKAAKKVGAKLLFDSHELEVHRNPPMSWIRRKMVERIEQKYLPQADKLLTVSEAIANHLAAEYKVYRPTVLFNAPQTKLTPMPERWEVYDRDDIRLDLRLSPKDFLLVYTGNITTNRGLETVLIALSKLRGYKDPNERFRGEIHFAAVGRVQGAQDEIIKHIAKIYNVSELLHFLPPVAPHRVTEYISRADAAIIPVYPLTLSYEYAMPNKLFEGAIAGLPIIASDLVELSAFVKEHKLGLSYPADKPSLCADAIMEVIENYDKFQRTPEQQKEFINQFSWEAQERKLLKVYEDMG